jgi:hypothetical protein
MAARWCAQCLGHQADFNVCQHRRSIMLQGRGSTGSNIVCPRTAGPTTPRANWLVRRI